MPPVNSQNTLSQGPPLLCIDECRYERKECASAGDMIRCCQCGLWFHINCLNLPKDETMGVWPCLECRKIPKKIDEMQADIKAILAGQSEMMKLIKANTNDLRSIETENVVQSEAVSFLRDTVALADSALMAAALSSSDFW